MSENQKTYCGYVAIIGRPNVGKSTLLNRLLSAKVSITSHKPQTTRHRILGIKTVDNYQAVYVDTPGIHQEGKHAINRYMNRVATQVLTDVDVVGFMVEAGRWTSEDEWVLEKLKKVTAPVILIINKVDQVHPLTELLAYIDKVKDKREFTEIVPVSAKNGANVDAFAATVTKFFPESPHLFSAEQLTDRGDRFLTSEIIREKLMRYLHQELPYSLTVEIEQFEVKKKILHIYATIWLEREGQKTIVIGKNGEMLKKIGREARLDLEKIFGKKVFLQLWTKVKENWSDDLKAMKSLGYDG